MSFLAFNPNPPWTFPLEIQIWSLTGTEVYPKLHSYRTLTGKGLQTSKASKKIAGSSS